MSTVSNEEAQQAVFYHYKHAFSGFAAMLNASQAKMLAKSEEVVSVFESKVLQVQTTRSWDFMGLDLDSSNPLQLRYGDDVIVGVIDTGVWPESDSFKEEPGMGPIPKSWRGECVGGEQFEPKRACNRKLIGARYYLAGFESEFGKINPDENFTEYRSARDFEGHGTHTASTAVGSISNGASLSGFGRGRARGGAPRARLAVYKACWTMEGKVGVIRTMEGKCSEADLLAAFDDALRDGVHVISASFGDSPPLSPFSNSASDIGSFHAMQNGVSVVFSAGNSGPDPSLVENVNPWSISVAASTIDRTFPTKILIHTHTHTDTNTTDADIGTSSSSSSYLTLYVCIYVCLFHSRTCSPYTRNGNDASGKIMLCFSISTDSPVPSLIMELGAFIANASAVIIVQALTKPVASEGILLPTIHIDNIQGTRLHQYSNMTKLTILPSETAFRRSPAPIVSDYSSRGPSSISPSILKPDISAPGTNILASSCPKPSKHIVGPDDRSVWKFDSGTSMACPHVSGIVALLKSAHQNWSPAAIRSAIMTTAHNLDVNGDGILAQPTTKTANAFDIGAGHVNPLKAIDPGLVYDMKARDYVFFLCNNGYSNKQIKAIAKCQPQDTCPKCSDPNRVSDMNLNYPSITVPDLKNSTTVKRTVRNVGQKNPTTYNVSIVKPNGVQVVVRPTTMRFSSVNQEKTYYVTLTPLKESEGRYDFGSITWSDGSHRVRSPLVVQINNLPAQSN
ncbi:Subtilisin-like serine endopeptidase family protein [Striga hermonthica]|uniref:Subtilisin-like serine endopeptidase family protein n=1 Tax=Striga hermonthica TaxID=68872 RepID=A0A9N7NHM2_STRHE|nr:Subtilisin-like serine endopeptidase family protein [Striga hermonthica]